MIAAIVILAALPTRVVAVTTSTKNPVVIHCPVGATTRIVFPEPVMASLSPGMQKKLGIGWEPGSRSKVALVRPAEYPAQGVLQFTGRQFGRFVVRLEAVSNGASTEVTLTPPQAATARPVGKVRPSVPPPAPPASTRAQATARQDRDPTAAPSPAAGEAFWSALPKRPAEPVVGPDSKHDSPASPTPKSSPQPASLIPANVHTETADRPPGMAASTKSVPDLAASTTRAEGLLDREILRARLRPVGRVESMPGQREVELADILEGENYLWLRFNVRGGARARVGEVSWEHGPISSFTTEVVNNGKDLLVVVQLPKARTTKRTRVTLRLDDGVRRFPLSAPWLSSLVKDILGF